MFSLEVDEFAISSGENDVAHRFARWLSRDLVSRKSVQILLQYLLHF